MSYRIPTDKKIEGILRKIFKKINIVNSQQQLKQLVQKELDKKKKKYGISQSRIRKIAINSNFVKIEIYSREGNPKKSMIKCPVCGDNLQKVKNLTIWGGEVTIELKCSKCQYWTGKKKRVPTRYIFHSKII